MILSQLTPGQRGIVKKIKGCGAIRRRILDIGIVPGTAVEVQKFAPLGDPIEIKVKGFNLSLRRNEAAMIEIDIA